MVPPHGTPYLESVDKEKFYQMTNMLLKRTWPIAVGITNEKEEYIPVILDLSTDDHPDADVPDRIVDDEWVDV